jgi:hypothetical protein
LPVVDVLLCVRFDGGEQVAEFVLHRPACAIGPPSACAVAARPGQLYNKCRARKVIAAGRGYRAISAGTMSA